MAYLMVLALQSVAVGAEGVHGSAVPHQRLDLPLGEILHHGDKGVVGLGAQVTPCRFWQPCLHENIPGG